MPYRMHFAHPGDEVEWWCGIVPVPLFILSFQMSVVPFKYFYCVLLKYCFDHSKINGIKML